MQTDLWENLTMFFLSLISPRIRSRPVFSQPCMPFWVWGPFRGVGRGGAPIFWGPVTQNRFILDHMFVWGAHTNVTLTSLQKKIQGHMTSSDDVTGHFMLKFANFRIMTSESLFMEYRFDQNMSTVIFYL